MLLFPLRSHRDCKELPWQPLRSRGAPTTSIGVYHCVVSNPTKWYKSSLVIATPIVCSSFVNIIMAVERQQAGLFLAYICMSSRSRMMQTLCTSFRDECVGGPQGVGEFGYGNGWTLTGGWCMVTSIGLCMSSGMKTLPVTLMS